MDLATAFLTGVFVSLGLTFTPPVIYFAKVAGAMAWAVFYRLAGGPRLCPKCKLPRQEGP